METSYLKTLELDKIIARAAEGCVCKEAKAKLLALEPQCDPDEVRYALEQTDAINTLLIKNGSPRFGGVEGVSALAARAVKGGVLSMGELLMVAGALRNFQNLTNWYGSSEHDMLPTDDLFYALSPEPGLEQQISSAILAPDAMADTASRTLNDLRKKIRATENSIRDRLESMVRNMDTSKYLQESVVSMRNGRYVVPVKSEYRGEVSGIIHDVSSTGATVFVEPQAVVEANARILQYRAQEAQEIERILVAFTAQVAAIEPQFQYSYQAMLDIDVLLAKARLALELKAFKPAVRTDQVGIFVRFKIRETDNDALRIKRGTQRRDPFSQTTNVKFTRRIKTFHHLADFVLQLRFLIVKLKQCAWVDANHTVDDKFQTRKAHAFVR